jgi:hypothetical protein
MRIVARIEKMAGDQYILDGKTFDSFLSARREMIEERRRRRHARRASRVGEPRFQAMGA